MARAKYGWVLFRTGQHLCGECSCFTSTAWLYYATSTEATLRICEGCAARFTTEKTAYDEDSRGHRRSRNRGPASSCAALQGEGGKPAGSYAVLLSTCHGR